MRGDFSHWRSERAYNFSGVLHQQGRVLLDRDWNAQTELTIGWEDEAGRDIVGAGVAGVPADAPDAFRISRADRGGADIVLDVGCGRVWADGIPIALWGAGTVQRIATYLGPPVQSPQATKGTIQDGVTRDAVVLEVWREELNAFQLEDLLVEHALGGPDTTERVLTSCALRLYRMAAGQTCESIVPELRDRFADKGKLTASLKQPTVSGDCPVVIGGGYTGFEHNLYRVEIAQTNDAANAWFTWSQYNGGLVGRGAYDAGKNAFVIAANAQAILNAGLGSFYLEVVEYDPTAPATLGRGHWRVTFGQSATLDSNGDLKLTGSVVFGSAPPTAGRQIFFRLWNDIRKISDFPTPVAPADPNELIYGIRLAFDSAAVATYTPGDYWTFPVRAGEIENPVTLVDAAAPQGIHYHRVVLGVLSWNGQVITAGAGISDCRQLFHPLTRLQTCCSYRVGDGMKSHGDFTSIQKAIEALPDAGGEICVLPGVYKENVEIRGRSNITIKGCGARSRVISPEAADLADAKPVFLIEASRGITLQSLAVEAHRNGQGVLMEGSPVPVADPSVPPEKAGVLTGVTLERLRITAAAGAAIEGHVLFSGAIRDCAISMQDAATLWPAIFMIAEDLVIERNTIRVIAKQETTAAFDNPSTGTPVIAGAGRGGIQIGGASERVTIRENLIRGGTGCGITLGSLKEESEGGKRNVPTGHPRPDTCSPGTLVVVTTTVGGQTTVLVSEGDLYEIVIERNDIYDMGLDGIGPVAFFEPGDTTEMIGIHGLRILSNVIRRCLNRTVAEIEKNQIDAVAYGAIVLPDVDDLIVRDNLIEGIGFDPSLPVCGIFVLHAEGIEIARNHIWCHPVLKGDAPSGSAKSLKPGVRAGIAFVSTTPVAQPQAAGAVPGAPVNVKGESVSSGSDRKTPCKLAVVHENEVSTMTGQALLVSALGPLSVTDNQFESNGYDPSFGASSTVFILDLGIYQDILWMILALYLSKSRDQQYFSCDLGRLVLSGGDVAAQQQQMPRFPSGNVLFADNQCRLSLVESAPVASIASILIASLDDVDFHGNQSDCALGASWMFMSALLLGISLRVTDNRFKEDLTNANVSAFTFGLMNTTMMNQGDHCFIVRGLPPFVQDAPNTTMMRMFCPYACEPFDSWFPNYRKSPLYDIKA